MVRAGPDLRPGVRKPQHGERLAVHQVPDRVRVRMAFEGEGRHYIDVALAVHVEIALSRPVELGMHPGQDLDVETPQYRVDCGHAYARPGSIPLDRRPGC